MLGISAAVGSPVASAPTSTPATTASANTTSTGCSQTVATTSRANNPAAPHQPRGETEFGRDRSATVNRGKQEPASLHALIVCLPRHTIMRRVRRPDIGRWHPPHPVEPGITMLRTCTRLTCETPYCDGL